MKRYLRFHRAIVLRSFLLIGIIVVSALFLSGCKKIDDSDMSSETETVEENGGDDEILQDNETETSAEQPGNEGGFDKFSSETQTIGNSSGKEDADYILQSITDTPMDGYHRFEFKLDSDESDLPKIQAKLVSSGGYIDLRLDRVTRDTSGIGYQSSRTISKEGILRIYHQVSAVQTEEVYQIGITDDTIFYLHEGTGLTVILDVKYPGSSHNVSAEDPMDFTDGDVILEGTNTAGDVRIGSYSWGVEGTVLRYSWATSSASGNPVPGTNVEYNTADKTLNVKLTNVSSDVVIGSDGTYSADLISPVTNVSGTRSGTTSTYVFTLHKNTTYRIYNTQSPNMLILEIMR